MEWTDRMEVEWEERTGEGEGEKGREVERRRGIDEKGGKEGSRKEEREKVEGWNSERKKGEG